MSFPTPAPSGQPPRSPDRLTPDHAPPAESDSPAARPAAARAPGDTQRPEGRPAAHAARAPGTDAAISHTKPAAPSGPLAALARRANDAHRAFSRGTGEALAHAIEAGSALRQAKQQVAAGAWLPWLEHNVEFSERTARLYMQLAAHPAMADRQRVADLSLRAAAKLVAVARAARSPEATGAPRVEATGAARPQLATRDSQPQPPAPDSAARERGETTLDPAQCTRARQALDAIAPRLARAQSDELPIPARAKLLREAAGAARALSAALDAIADQLTQ